MNNEERLMYLRDLAERLMRVPVTYGVDQGDIDTLLNIAKELEDFRLKIIKER